MSKGTPYELGFKAGVKYWTDRPWMIVMPEAKKKWLYAQDPEFVRGFHDGANEAPDVIDGEQ